MKVVVSIAGNNFPFNSWALEDGAGVIGLLKSASPGEFDVEVLVERNDGKLHEIFQVSLPDEKYGKRNPDSSSDEEAQHWGVEIAAVLQRELSRQRAQSEV